MSGMDPSKLHIDAGWLVYDVGQHTCGGYGPESGYAHEPGCGYDPVITLAELAQVLTAHFAAQVAEAKSQGGVTTDNEVPW